MAEGVNCHYSAKKTMGRPRKRRRAEENDNKETDDGIDILGHTEFDGMDSTLVDPNLAIMSSNLLGTIALQSGNTDIALGGALVNGSYNGVHQSQDEQYTSQSWEMPDFGFSSDFPMFDQVQDSNTWLPTMTATPPQSASPPGAISVNTDSSLVKAEAKGCSCLGKLYTTLATFQNPPPPSFPFSMGDLRKATSIGFEVVRCQICPGKYNTAVQNSMLLGTLLQMVINEYARLLKHIDERSASGETIGFRVGEVSSCLDQRHTGTPDCPMAINVDLGGEEWRMLARKSIRQEVLGNNEDSLCLQSIIQQMRDRQAMWHGRSTHNDFHVDCTELGQKEQNSQRICAQIAHIDTLKKMVETLKL